MGCDLLQKKLPNALFIAKDMHFKKSSLPKTSYDFLVKIKNVQGKAWVEWYCHSDAYNAMESIGKREVNHMNLPITVQM